jgi:hypothetical protein
MIKWSWQSDTELNAERLNPQITTKFYFLIIGRDSAIFTPCLDSVT